MAPTIGRQWRGGSQDYAALCDYCDVRYLRSQLQKLGNGRLACMGPGTNSCGAGRDEVTLDKINADIARNRRRPAPHRGGRFDRIVASVEDIFGATLREYWDARSGVESSSDGALTSWTGQKLGMVFSLGASSTATWSSSVPEFYNRPAIEVTAGELVTDTGALMPSGGRPYIGAVISSPKDEAGSIQFFNGMTAKASLARDVGGGGFSSLYVSVAAPGGTSLPIPAAEVGSVRHAYLHELDATAALAFRVGTAEVQTSVSSPTDTFWNRVTVQLGGTLALLVVANAPTESQVEAFQALGRSYAVRLQ